MDFLLNNTKAYVIVFLKFLSITRNNFPIGLEIYGDFEDLETGEVINSKTKNDDSNNEEEEENEDEDEDDKKVSQSEGNLETTEKRKAKKKKLKEMFNADYDEEKGKTFFLCYFILLCYFVMAIRFNSNLQCCVKFLGPNTYYDDLKNTMTDQAELNRKEFENLDDDVRVQYEGFRAGLYVRIEVYI